MKRITFVAAAALAGVLLLASACSPKITGAASPKFLPVSEISTLAYDTIPQWELPEDSLYMNCPEPNFSNILPPPDSSSPAFQKDLERYKWGKQQRSTPRGKQASYESLYGIVRMATIYSDLLGFVIHPSTTPAIYRLMLYSGETAYRNTMAIKDKHKRKRPFELMGEDIWGEFDGDYLRGDGSYPSGHTALGWTTALVLAEIAPEYKDQILERGRQYGESRVIVGAHWQSDVDAGYMIGASTFDAIQNDPRYKLHLQEARKEYQTLKNNSH